MGLEIALATYIGHHCINRDKVRTISSKVEVLEALTMFSQSELLKRQDLVILQMCNTDMGRL